MVFRVFIFIFFCLEPTLRKDILMRMTSVTVIVVFWKYYAESYLITAVFKVRSQQSLATLTAVFWKMPDSWRFYRHGSTCLLIFVGQFSWSGYQRKCVQNYHLRKKPGLYFKEHFTSMEDDISLILIRFFFCPRNLIFEFSLVLIK